MPQHTARAKPDRISLLLADVDGTLVTEEKVLTPRAIRAVQALRAQGTRFAITSGRPPRGMTMLTGPLGLDTPIAGFNAGLFVDADMKTIEAKTLPPEIARKRSRSSWIRVWTRGFTPATIGWSARSTRPTWPAKPGRSSSSRS